MAPSSARLREKEGRVAELDAEAFRWLSRGREANLELGRVFNQLKKILGHGTWLHHFKETFKSSGISLRTCENYMRAAREADSKFARFSNLKPANDEAAQEIEDATQRAEAELGALPSPNKLRQTARLYQLPLHLTKDERDAMDALRRSAEWPRAEEQVVRLLRRLWVRYGTDNNDTRRRS